MLKDYSADKDLKCVCGVRDLVSHHGSCMVFSASICVLKSCDDSRLRGATAARLTTTRIVEKKPSIARILMLYSGELESVNKSVVIINDKEDFNGCTHSSRTRASSNSQWRRRRYLGREDLEGNADIV